VTCRVLGVRRQGYYEFIAAVKSARVQENELLLKHIEKVHEESRGTYGWPRVHAELTLGLGLAVNHKRVARLMREAGLQGLYRRRRRGCTVRDPSADPYPDLVERRFTVGAPDRLWVTDIERHEALVRREALGTEGGVSPPRWAVAAAGWELSAV
jgi:putative transposase